MCNCNNIFKKIKCNKSQILSKGKTIEGSCYCLSKIIYPPIDTYYRVDLYDCNGNRLHNKCKIFKDRDECMKYLTKVFVYD